MMRLPSALCALSLLALGACGQDDPTRNFTTEVGTVTVNVESTGIYNTDGTERLVFNFVPRTPRSIAERAYLAEMATDEMRGCRWVEKSHAELSQMTMIEPRGVQGSALIGAVRC